MLSVSEAVERCKVKFEFLSLTLITQLHGNWVGTIDYRCEERTKSDELRSNIGALDRA